MALVRAVGVAEGETLELELALAEAEVAPDGVCVAGAEDEAGWGEFPLVQAARTRHPAAAALRIAALRRGGDGCGTCPTLTSGPGILGASPPAWRSLIAQQFGGRQTVDEPGGRQRSQQ